MKQEKLKFIKLFTPILQLLYIMKNITTGQVRAVHGSIRGRGDWKKLLNYRFHLLNVSQNSQRSCVILASEEAINRVVSFGRNEKQCG